MTNIKQQTDFEEAPIDDITPGDLVEIVLNTEKKRKLAFLKKDSQATIFEVADTKYDLKVIESVAGYYAGWFRYKDAKPGIYIQPTQMEWTSSPRSYIRIPINAVKSCQLLKKAEKNNGDNRGRVGWWTPAFP